MLAIALLTIAYVVGNRVGAHPIALVLYAMTVSAVALLAVTGVGRDALSIVLAPQTWLVGIGTIGLELFYFLLLVHVSPALGSLLLRIAIPLSLAAGWTLFRAPAGAAVAARCRRGAARYRAANAHDRRRQSPARGGGRVRLRRCLHAPLVRHRIPPLEQERADGDGEAACDRPGGARTSLAALALTGLAALLVGVGLLPATHLVPTAAEMLHAPTVLLGGIVNAAIMTAMAVLSFSAVVKITTENFTATHAFTPVGTLLVQMAASAVGLIPVYALDPSLLPSMGVVIVGVLLILYAARRR